MSYSDLNINAQYPTDGASWHNASSLCVLRLRCLSKNDISPFRNAGEILSVLQRDVDLFPDEELQQSAR